MTTETDAPAATPAAAASPFTMLPGAAGAMVCEGDVCYVPGLAADESTGSPAPAE